MLPARRPMIVTTTSSSSSVKPRPLRTSRRTVIDASVEIPVADIGVDTFATLLAVGPVREHVEWSVLTGRAVLIRVVARIERHLAPAEIAAGIPVRRRRFSRISDERLEAFFGGRVAEVVEVVELQGRLDRANVRFRAIDRGGIDAAEQLRTDDRGEQADDDHDNHDLDQREAALGCRSPE